MGGFKEIKKKKKFTGILLDYKCCKIKGYKAGKKGRKAADL